MPGGDRTGPAGLGSMTGRGAGYCAGYPVPGYMNPAWGRGGGGRGWGGGGGGWRHRHWYCATGVPGWQRAASGWPGYAPPLPTAFGPLVTKEQALTALKTRPSTSSRHWTTCKIESKRLSCPPKAQTANNRSRFGISGRRDRSLSCNSAIHRSAFPRVRRKSQICKD
jgi:hypothetical protein